MGFARRFYFSPALPRLVGRLGLSIASRARFAVMGFRPRAKATMQLAPARAIKVAPLAGHPRSIASAADQCMQIGGQRYVRRAGWFPPTNRGRFPPPFLPEHIPQLFPLGIARLLRLPVAPPFPAKPVQIGGHHCTASQSTGFAVRERRHNQPSQSSPRQCATLDVKANRRAPSSRSASPPFPACLPIPNRSDALQPSAAALSP